jgi:hypothetical protein
MKLLESSGWVGIRKAWPLIIVVLAGLAFSEVVPVAFAPRLRGLRAAWRSSEDGDSARDRPISVRPVVDRLIAVSPTDMQWVRRQIQPSPRVKLNSSYCLHLLRVHRFESELDSASFPSGKELMKLLTDDRAGAAYFGREPLVLTRTGVRFLTGDAQAALKDNSLEWHRDQTLAAFGELGVPLTHPLSVAGRVLPLRDVLQDSLANFHLKQKELAWTAMAYALYLPPIRAWTNRFGEVYSFDRLVDEMLGRSPGAGSCGGTHDLYSLTIVARCDREIPLLSEPVRARLVSHLKRCADVAVRGQRPDGSWRATWNRELLPASERSGLTPEDVASDSLLMTGHLAEWFLYLPVDLRPADADQVLRRAAHWLNNALHAAKEDDLTRSFCPYSHATCVLRQLQFVP